jgi:SAM-dependent methyltransferase
MQLNPNNNWLETALGQYLLHEEKAMFDQVVTDIFGFNAIQLGLLEVNLLEQSRIPNCMQASTTFGNLLCETEYLPIAASTMDLICLPHALEFCQNPHQTLREVERVLVPEGHVIITGINPISSWGLRRKLSRHHDYPWCGRSLSSGRIKDWLALLGLETIHHGNLAFILPINKPAWVKRQGAVEQCGHRYCSLIGGVFYIVAKKRVANMRLLKPNWKKSLAGNNLLPSANKTKPIKNKKSLKE